MLGKTIGKYRIIREIGEGGMATVYEGQHEVLDSRVAIKVLNPQLSANLQIRERFRKEAKLMASLDHPNITRVLDFEETSGELCIVMEFLNGQDLSSKIKTNGPLQDDELIRIFSQVLNALQYAHEKQIAHRDIKPSNIYILPDGTVKILDFGIAKIFGDGLDKTHTGALLGTPMYMSPEQVRVDKSIDHRTDIYSLGVTMYYALTGKPLYDDDSESWFHISNKIVFENLTEIKSRFWPIIQRACHKVRNLRYQECKEWLKDLQHLNNERNTLDATIIYGGNTTTGKGLNETVEWDVKDFLIDARTLSKLETKLDELWKKQKYSISPDELIQAGVDGGFNKEYEFVCGKYRLHRLNHLSAFDVSRANNFEETTDKNGITKFLFITAVGLISLVLLGLLVNTCNESNSAEARLKYLSDSINLTLHQRNTDSITAAQTADSTRLAAIADSTYAAANAQRIADSTLVANFADSAQQANSISTVTLPTNADNTRNIAGGEVRIGRQIWMTTNLNVDRFRNGDPISQARTAEEWKRAGEQGRPAWCYYKNDPTNGAKYGKLYNWYAVNDPRGLAPVGFHIPSDKEWTALTEFLGGKDGAGTKMKSTSGWANNGNGSNSSGFSGLPGGDRSGEGIFYDVGYFGYWWSSTEFYSNDCWYLKLVYDRGFVYTYSSAMVKGLSVRCLKN
jgi:uncharacterized protein (TIGR02145 family)